MNIDASRSTRKSILFLLMTILALAGVILILTTAARAQGMPGPIPPGPGGALDGSRKLASRFMLGPGETVTFTIDLFNSSQAAVTATVTDPLPAALTYVDGSATAGGVFDPATKTVKWTDVSVPAGAHLPLKLAASASTSTAAAVMAVNDATIQPAGGIPFHRTAMVLLAPPMPGQHSDLDGSQKMASERTVGPGEVFTYTIQLNNSGEADAPVSVRDPLPREVSYVLGSANLGGMYDPAMRTLSWSGLSVPAGQSLALVFQVKAAPFIIRPMPVRNVAAILPEGERPLWRQAVVILAPAPGTGDFIPPVVHRVTIGGGDVLTSPTTTLHISATDNVAVKWMFIRQWDLSTRPSPHWQEMRSSGWVPFQADYPWTLKNVSGAHFVGVWVADAARNVSHMNRNAMDFASLLLPGAAIPQNGLVPYLVYYNAGVDVTAKLTPLSGDVDLHVWYPGNMFRPDHESAAGGTGPITVTFTTPRAGVYIFLVRGVAASTYDLSITPAGGFYPAAAASILAPISPDLSVPSAPTAGFDFEPILSISGVDPLSQANAPSLFNYIYIPAVNR